MWSLLHHQCYVFVWYYYFYHEITPNTTPDALHEWWENHDQPQRRVCSAYVCTERSDQAGGRIYLQCSNESPVGISLTERRPLHWREIIILLLLKTSYQWESGFLVCELRVLNIRTAREFLTREREGWGIVYSYAAIPSSGSYQGQSNNWEVKIHFCVGVPWRL